MKIKKKFFVTFFIIIIFFSILKIVKDIYKISVYENKIIYIEHNTSNKKIAEILKKNNLIENKELFLVVTRLRNFFMGNYLIAGEYEIKKNSNLINIIQLLEKGEVLKHKITILPYLSNYQIKEILEKEDLLIGNTVMPIIEGELMPETYYFKRGDTKESIIKHMQLKHREFLDINLKNYVGNFSKKEIMIIASIIEKEAANNAEKPLISSVFHNRLKLNMPLQADPTIIYALTNGRYDLGRILTKNDLKFNSPYNTYIYKGLPPGPICNPGRDSIIAAINPIESKYLYFVLSENGVHKFAVNYLDHNQNVINWKKINLKNKPSKIPGIKKEE